MADVKISEQLFVELYKWFCIDPKLANFDYIVLELQKKNDRLAAHLEYSAALSAKRKTDA